MILNYYFFRQKYSPYSNPHISFSILMADSERNTWSRKVISYFIIAIISWASINSLFVIILCFKFFFLFQLPIATIRYAPSRKVNPLIPI